MSIEHSNASRLTINYSLTFTFLLLLLEMKEGIVLLGHHKSSILRLMDNEAALLQMAEPNNLRKFMYNNSLLD